MTEPEEPFAHLVHMTNAFGTFEHANHTAPRREHGYCTDDMARVLVVTTRQERPGPGARLLARSAMEFLTDAQSGTGAMRNRRTSLGHWADAATVEDCWGRTLWGFGTAAARGHDEWMRAAALARFERGAVLRSPWLRPMAFAALGAAEVLGVHTGHRVALDLMTDVADVLQPGPARRSGAAWPWPEPRLTYANAVIPEAMIATGHALGRCSLVEQGLALLGWLLEQQTVDGHLSVVPAGGAGPGDLGKAAFDQQPIEVAALADACARAALVSPSARWTAGVDMAVRWFSGANDVGAVMWDPLTGGGYDGLQAHGPNLNEGTESTLAFVATRQLVGGGVPR